MEWHLRDCWKDISASSSKCIKDVGLELTSFFMLQVMLRKLIVNYGIIEKNVNYGIISICVVLMYFIKIYFCFWGI